MNECIKGSDVLIIATPWNEYRKIVTADLVELMNEKYVLDPYRILDESQLTEYGFQYFTLGK